MTFSFIYTCNFPFFIRSNQDITKFPFEDFLMEFINNQDLEYDGHDDDDVYYMEIRRQILLLTADEDEEEFPHAKVSNPVAAAASKRVSSRLERCSSCGVKHGSSNSFPWWEVQNTNSAPAWLVNLWRRTGNGTGVFIPQNQAVQSRRRYRTSGRMMNNEKSRMYRARNRL
ncbi:uncharacterized protein LOC110630898 [Manihot esculenta]|uniref:Uncharacterized protein n=2 Tax=Manihot esculenta TaxID=3983 RepID=A0ACB7GH24_MANES|nr:uncharacterized protein LOC110630898 [Manihot esculenta]KAG8639089.1 hypothetical protein MANES_14G099300v8 [Manihot esculenta]